MHSRWQRFCSRLRLAYGMLRALGPISPWPVAGGPVGFLTGFVSFTVIGFVLGAIYGLAWEFWEKRLG
jgi:hypothetical protein